ncbi:MAG: ubiquinol-cytochrome C reductase, partial [Microbacterium sp.]|nr:ubiquinol-cytochrome C reductase [Microbacterium sp.]
MAHEEDPLEHERASWQPSPGLAVAVPDPVQNPDLPPHRERVTDKDPVAMKRAVRTVYTLFYLSVAGSIWAVAAYMIFPIEDGGIVSIRHNNLFIGLGIALALLAIGIGAIHWSKAIMSDKEFIEPRHATRGRDTTREAVVSAFAVANEESGFGRRAMIRNSLFAALVASIIPGITLFRGLAPQNSPGSPHAGDPVYLLSHTMWKKGMKLAHDPSGVPIKAEDVTLGSAFHVIPEELASVSHQDGYLEEKAKAIVLLMRLPVEDLHPAPGREDWGFDGIVAYSKVCTHVGCPVALYEQQT